MDEGRRIKVTNRHIAKVLTRLKPLNLPEIALDEIKREMWFLSEDLRDLGKRRESGFYEKNT